MGNTLTGFIVVAQAEGALEVPQQVAASGQAAAARRAHAGRRASLRRASLADRQPPYRLAIVTVVPAVSQISAWLAAHGWHTSQAGALWAGPHGCSVGVPDDDADPAVTMAVIERIAATAGMTAVALMGEMAAALMGEMAAAGPGGD